MTQTHGVIKKVPENSTNINCNFVTVFFCNQPHSYYWQRCDGLIVSEISIYIRGCSFSVKILSVSKYLCSIIETFYVCNHSLKKNFKLPPTIWIPSPLHVSPLFYCQFCAVSISTQPAITCSKLTIETLEQGVKYVQS